MVLQTPSTESKKDATSNLLKFSYRKASGLFKKVSILIKGFNSYTTSKFSVKRKALNIKLYLGNLGLIPNQGGL